MGFKTYTLSEQQQKLQIEALVNFRNCLRGRFVRASKTNEKKASKVAIQLKEVETLISQL